MATTIHPTAIVHENAKIGVDVIVGPYAIIEGEVEVGDACRVDAFAQIKAFTSLGRENHIHSYACVGGTPQDLKFHGEKSFLRLGDRNTIREFTTLNRGTEGGGGETLIGSNCLLMAYVHIAHDCLVSDNVIFSNGATLAGHVSVGQGAILGGMAGVHQFARIGQHAFVGGKTGVAQDVPPYILVAGERASMHGPNLVGLRRLGLSSDTIQAIKNVYRILWRSGLGKQEGLKEAEEKHGELEEVRQILDFVRTSERGVTPAA